MIAGPKYKPHQDDGDSDNDGERARLSLQPPLFKGRDTAHHS
jgi:hypothetical protein